MKAREYIAFYVGAAIVGVLFVLVTVFLGVEISRYCRATRIAQEARKRLNDFYARDPFPSEENVAQVTKNRDIAADVFATLHTKLKAGQITAPAGLQPVDFQNRFNEEQSALLAEATAKDVHVPERFAFGFERYAEGELPKEEHVPRLVQQLRMIDRLCRVLYEARIRELKSVTREEFEGLLQAVDPGRARSRGGRLGAADQAEALKNAGLIEAGELFAKLRFGLEFVASEGSLLEILNRLGADPLFVSVVSVSVKNEKDGAEPLVQVGAAARARAESGGAGADASVFAARRARLGQTTLAAQKSLREMPHDKRVMLGTEKLEVKLEVDVYIFADDA